jgi:purine nucleoside permease
MKKLLFSILFVGMIATSIFAGGKKETQIPIKVLILPKFEIGELKEDFPGEAQFYFENYFQGKVDIYEIKNTPEPLYVNSNGVALIVTLMGKAQSGQTVTSVLADNRFDFSKTLIISTGCAGSPADRTVLGDVVIGGVVIDHELGHGNDREDVGANGPLFIRDESYDFGGITVLEDSTVQWAFNLVKDIVLEDTERSREVTSLYGFNTRSPIVQIGTIITGDNYWAASVARQRVEEVVSAYQSPYPYLITEMEDAAIGVAVKRANLLEHYVVIRDSVDYDSPLKGESVLNFWEETSENGKSYDWGVFPVARKNNFLVGQAIIDEFLANPIF